MTNKLKEAIRRVQFELLGSGVLRICIPSCAEYERDIQDVVNVARTVLEAGDEVPKETPLSGGYNNMYDAKDLGYSEGWNDYRQAVLPVVAKKDMIIAEQDKSIGRLTNCLAQMIKYVRNQHDNPKFTVSVYTPHLEKAEEVLSDIMLNHNQTVAERGGERCE